MYRVKLNTRKSEYWYILPYFIKDKNKSTEQMRSLSHNCNFKMSLEHPSDSDFHTCRVLPATQFGRKFTEKSDVFEKI